MPFIGYVPPHDAHFCKPPFWALFLRRVGTLWQCRTCKRKWTTVRRFDTITGTHYRDWDRWFAE